MQNSLPDLELEDARYHLHAVPVEPESYNLVLVYPPKITVAPPPPPMSPDKVRANLKKLGIIL